MMPFYNFKNFSLNLETKKESFLNLFLLKFKNLLDDYIGNYFIKYLFFLLFISFFLCEFSFFFFDFCNLYFINSIVIDFTTFYFYNSILSSFLFDLFTFLFSNFFFSFIFYLINFIITSLYFNTSFLLFLLPTVVYLMVGYKQFNILDLFISFIISVLVLINPYFFFLLFILYYTNANNVIQKINISFFIKNKEVLYSFFFILVFYSFCYVKYLSFISFYSIEESSFILFIFFFIFCINLLIRSMSK